MQFHPSHHSKVGYPVRFAGSVASIFHTSDLRSVSSDPLNGPRTNTPPCIFALLMVTCLSVLCGCSGSREDDGSTTVVRAQGSTPATVPETANEQSDIGPEISTAPHIITAPEFSLPKMGGGKLALSSLKGKIVLLDFWATWCAPCMGELPEYQLLNARFASKGVAIVGVCVSSPTPEVARLREKYHLTFPILQADDHTVSQYAIAGLPHAFLLDRKGKVIQDVVGEPAPTTTGYWIPVLEQAVRGK